ncbi:MAG TPA: hypothetical protein VK541_19260 [Pedobacter sp.]|uniref:hypothetical protein n=1 Tax=Pedobacter sp. TaxID=1411316 RepID=UPI002BDCEAF3|nr:hypothetical protein [Pedobacter sp.]HMI04638.1 hypothetical protein [Pedobacter sp.]
MEESKDPTTKNIALVLLWGFIGVLALLIVVNLFVFKLNIGKNPDLTKGWFELLKNYLILLGTALTTVIGYYFGQREGAIKAEKASEEIRQTEQKAGAVVSEAIKQRDEAIKNNSGKDNDAADTDDAPADETDSSIQLPG